MSNSANEKPITTTNKSNSLLVQHSEILHVVVVTVMIRQPTLLIKRLHLLYEFAEAEMGMENAH
jgi:hypothetical protein